MAWWLWVTGGLALLVLEMVTPGGLFALFFGAGALCVAALAALGAGPVVQWITFPVLSVVLLAALRGRLQERLRPRVAPPVDSLIGQEVVLLRDVPAGGEGQAELRGVPWSVRAASGQPLATGQRCRVERVDGVVLYVKSV
jgi:inner membrane protein